MRDCATDIIMPHSQAGIEQRDADLSPRCHDVVALRQGSQVLYGAERDRCVPRMDGWMDGYTSDEGYAPALMSSDCYRCGSQAH